MDQDETKQLLKDMVYINAVLATELITVVEALAKVAYGETPELCKTQHRVLKEDIIAIAEKWRSKENCKMLYNHNLRHGENIETE